jgi:hypothetical protein
MKTLKEQNERYKFGVGTKEVFRERKRLFDLADFFGKSPANPQLCEQIHRALMNLSRNRRGNLTENDAFALGVLAYIYSYSIVEVERTLANCTHLIDLGQFDYFDGWNNLHILPTFLAPDSFSSHGQNNDTFCCGAALDLSREPVLLYTPDIGDRYFVYQFIDAHANSYAYAGTRATEGHEGIYAIVGPGWRGKLPDNLHWIQSMTPHNLMIGRIYIESSDEIPLAREIFSRSTLAPLSEFEKEKGNNLTIQYPCELAEPLEISGLKWFEFANCVLNENPPSADENDLIRLFARLGFGPGFDFQAQKMPSNVRFGMERAIPVAKSTIIHYARAMGETINGWRITLLNRNIRGTTYIERAAIAFERLAENSTEEVLCAEAYGDAEGIKLYGAESYVLRFEKGQEPPVRAFWSLTMYDLPGRLMVSNSIDRYSVRNRTRGLKRGTDGSLEIYLQKENPGEEKESNWLPAPEGDFFVVMRMYIPGEEIIGGHYRLPPIRRLG